MAASSDTSTARPRATVAIGTWPRQGRSAAVTATGAATAAGPTATGRVLDAISTVRSHQSWRGVADSGDPECLDTRVTISARPSTERQRGGPKRYPWRPTVTTISGCA